ncbi:hypothetical protein Tco_0409877 [Tanacetum coccineum]
MELVLEQTQQGTSHEVSVRTKRIEELKRKVKINGEKKEALLTLKQKPEHQSDTKVFTMTMEILLEPTSNKLLVDSILQAGNPVNEILLKLNLPDHRSILTYSKTHIKIKMERRSVKIKELQERCIIKAFKSSNQEKCEHVGPKVTSENAEGEIEKESDISLFFCVVDKDDDDDIRG